MAYNHGYNPDALPAHAEPEQAAQMLSYQQRPNNAPRPHSLSSPQGSSYGPQPSYQHKPPPPVPQPVQQLQPQHPPRISPNSSYNSNAYSHNYNAATSPPPPQNYGFGPPPQHHHGRSPPQSRPPGTPVPSGSKSATDASLFPLFKAVDKDGSGQLSERELGAALVNGDWTSFDLHTVKMMIRMFDSNKSGTIGFDEFCRLWAFLAAWRTLFDRFDEDTSGTISYSEYSKALVAFGYRLSPSFVSVLFGTYDKSGGNAMSFDLFVQSCIALKRMTDVFKRYDDDRDGYITMSFEEFLT
ncbi:hypothetical protein MMC12_002186, partial [Toensbergia leucococca]|nr:hypothetical protein [Toensbergia leucococca]